MTIESREIIERIRLKMPLVVTLPDPITGEPFTINRDNLLALLVIDASNLTFEAQTVAALYGEAARIRAAAHKAHQEAEVRFRIWKMHKRNECRARATDKKPNKEEIEDFYRSADDYQERYQEQIDLSAIVSLADDLKRAYEIKSRQLESLSRDSFGHNQIQKPGDRMGEVELERLAMDTHAASGAAQAAADFREGKNSPSGSGPAEDTVEEDNKPQRRRPAKRPASKGSSKKARSIRR